MKKISLSLTIGWLYPELMSTYGDRGNIICLQKRCEWRGVKALVKNLNVGFAADELKECDFLFMGGAQDRQQKIVSVDLNTNKVKYLKEMIEQGTPGLYICGAYQFLGKYYKEADGAIIKGLNILDLYTENPGEKFQRLIGNIVVELSNVILGTQSEAWRTPESPSFKVMRDSKRAPSSLARMTSTLIGFENHGGRTYIGKGIKPLGKVIKGFGNNVEDKIEGAIYKNSFGSYLHGPILPKNPHFADYLIKLALEMKYKRTFDLPPLDDTLELQAHNAIAKRMGIAI